MKNTKFKLNLLTVPLKFLDLFVEAYVKSFGLPAVIMRPFNTYGPRQSEAVIPSIIRQVLDDNIQSIRVGSLDTKRDFNFMKIQ